jgi:hypothetical protein
MSENSPSLVTLATIDVGKKKKVFEQGCQMVCFQTKNPQFGLILEGLRMKNAGKFYSYLEYFTVIW